jgi:hypothetical protein
MSEKDLTGDQSFGHEAAKDQDKVDQLMNKADQDEQAVLDKIGNERQEKPRAAGKAEPTD